MELTPFSTIESTEEFFQILHAETAKVHEEIRALLENDDGEQPRRVEALRLVLHKLNQFRAHSESSLRLLHDLRTLRGLLLR